MAAAQVAANNAAVGGGVADAAIVPDAFEIGDRVNCSDTPTEVECFTKEELAAAQERIYTALQSNNAADQTRANYAAVANKLFARLPVPIVSGAVAAAPAAERRHTVTVAKVSDRLCTDADHFTIWDAVCEFPGADGREMEAVLYALLLDGFIECLNYSDHGPDGTTTPLVHAIKISSVDGVDLLLRIRHLPPALRLDPNRCDPASDLSPLAVTVEKDEVGLVQFLAPVSNDESLNDTADRPWTPLFLALNRIRTADQTTTSAAALVELYDLLNALLARVDPGGAGGLHVVGVTFPAHALLKPGRLSANADLKECNNPTGRMLQPADFLPAPDSYADAEVRASAHRTAATMRAIAAYRGSVARVLSDTLTPVMPAALVPLVTHYMLAPERVVDHTQPNAYWSSRSWPFYL